MCVRSSNPPILSSQMKQNLNVCILKPRDSANTGHYNIVQVKELSVNLARQLDRQDNNSEILIRIIIPKYAVVPPGFPEQLQFFFDTKAPYNVYRYDFERASTQFSITIIKCTVWL